MNQRLLVEGQDDIIVTAKICKKKGLLPPRGYDNPRKFKNEFVVECGGKGGVFKNIPVVLKEPELSNLGIILDANQDGVSNVWKRLKGVFEREGLSPLPNSFPKEGYVSEMNSLPIQIGVWLMPNNFNKGYLEHFLGQIIPKKSNEIWNQVNSVMRELDKKSLINFSRVMEQKAKMHTWLAWQNKPGLPFGQAIEANYFDLDHELVNQFTTWFQRTFVLER